ncbi:MAG: F0F1 ATP synthase subunit epsilon [Aeriscardovia sp.]|nr:F0F1 ATP synthase subunit epsilon [Aeriscardovia sp.]
MAAKSFELTLASKEGPLWEGEASQVEVPALGGGLTFLPGHASMLVLLAKGEMKVKAGKDLSFAIEGGIASFDRDRMVVAVDSGRSE